MTPAARLALGLGFVLVAACGEAPASRAAEGAATDGAASPIALARAPLRDPELADVRAHLERGRGDLALPLLERVQGLEAELLRARAELARGEAVACLSALERARELAPEHPEMAGTEVELLVALERQQAAAERLAAAFTRSGADPALLRAQGVFELRNQGHGPVALEALERARARDPELPFVRFPLAQAHMLVGRARLEHAPAETLVHARAALLLWPELPASDPLRLEVRELEAEGLTGERRFEDALAVYADLEAQGRRFGEVPATLQQRWATQCLLQRDRAGAVEHYLAARSLGLGDEGLGFGVEVLAEDARAALDRGLAAAEGGDWATAEEEFARALLLRPGDLEAENHLAVARFQRADYAGAAEAWEHVLAGAQREALALPDPVPLNLAKALRLAGERERARGVLSDLVDREPEGPFTEEARKLLLVLEAEALGGR
jgi:tetratricopeptide (TPR) repeat protein